MCSPRSVSLWLGLFLLCCRVSGALYEDPAQLPARTYDYIVVGCQSLSIMLASFYRPDTYTAIPLIAGPGGGTVASRLSSKYSVLVIEAGIKYVAFVHGVRRGSDTDFESWHMKR